jgi:hypothetical protein
MTSFWDWRKSEKLKKILENNGAIPDATDEDKIISLIVRDSHAATAQTHISAPLIREKFNIASRRKVVLRSRRRLPPPLRRPTPPKRPMRLRSRPTSTLKLDSGPGCVEL